MNAEVLTKLFEQSIDRLIKEVESYNDEANLWKTDGTVNNSAGTLTLHLAGNLNHFIGAVIGENGYVRNRAAEFSLTDIPRADLVKSLEATKMVVTTSLQALRPAHLDLDYPLEVFGYVMSNGYFLTHLIGHLNYHLGQVSYHRRLLD
jgi:uncharacterized damage-inducible protein DinB